MPAPDEDAPYALLSPDECARRRALLAALPSMRPLAEFVQALRLRHGPACVIPDFDPCDGGTEARALFLLEAPGPRARVSGFASRNNPDQTARNLCGLMGAAGIARTDTLLWNIVPWYVGTSSRIRPVTPQDIAEAQAALRGLLALLPRLALIVLVGRKAQSARPFLQTLTPVPIMVTYHMSPQVFNISPALEAADAERLSRHRPRSAKRLIRIGLVSAWAPVFPRREAVIYSPVPGVWCLRPGRVPGV